MGFFPLGILHVSLQTLQLAFIYVQNSMPMQTIMWPVTC